MFTFFSSQITAIKHLKIRERQTIIALSLDMLSPTERVILRIVKLLLLSPFFLIFTLFEGWVLIPFLILAGLSYPLITNPIEINFAKKHINNALKKHSQGK